jgi:hypothetical protein
VMIIAGICIYEHEGLVFHNTVEDHNMCQNTYSRFGDAGTLYQRKNGFFMMPTLLSYARLAGSTCHASHQETTLAIRYELIRHQSCKGYCIMVTQRYHQHQQVPWYPPYQRKNGFFMMPTLLSLYYHTPEYLHHWCIISTIENGYKKYSNYRVITVSIHMIL